MMCRKAALAATALALLPWLTAAPAQARGLFGGKPASKPSAASAPSPPDAAAKPLRITPAEREAADRLEPLARAAFWARVTTHDAGDADAQLRFASALRALGRFDEAGAAAEKAMTLQPGSEEGMLEFGRARIGAGQGFYAIDALNRAAAAAPRDWRPHSLLGVAMEQVLSNLALLDASEGDRTTAEALLRRAAAQPTSTVQERANLALVLGLAGKVAEAEQIIRRDLPPDLAEQNLAYLRAASPTR